MPRDLESTTAPEEWGYSMTTREEDSAGFIRLDELYTFNPHFPDDFPRLGMRFAPHT